MTIGGFSRNGSTVSWAITNNTGGTVRIDVLDINWPGSNEALFNVFIDGGLVWAGGSFSPPTHIASWIGSSSAREVGGGTPLELYFGSAAPSGYNLQLSFSNGCELSKAN